MIALALTNIGALELPLKEGTMTTDFDKVIPVLLMKYMPVGVLGLGLTALMASFMSGMAGNVSAFNTVFTYDIYQSYIKPNKADKHYLKVGQWTTVVGVLVSIMTAYVARSFNNVMDFLQLIFAFVNAPLFAAFLLGMFWKRTTGHAAFWGLIGGTISAAITMDLHCLQGQRPGSREATLDLFIPIPVKWHRISGPPSMPFPQHCLITFLITLVTKRTKNR